jgi:hypothetical protein
MTDAWEDSFPPEGWEPSAEDVRRMREAPVVDLDAHMGGDREAERGGQWLREQEDLDEQQLRKDGPRERQREEPERQRPEQERRQLVELLREERAVFARQMESLSDRVASQLREELERMLPELEKAEALRRARQVQAEAAATAVLASLVPIGSIKFVPPLAPLWQPGGVRTASPSKIDPGALRTVKEMLESRQRALQTRSALVASDWILLDVTASTHGR